MKVYVAMIDDTHTDTEPYVFSTPELAIEYAREQAQELARGYWVQELAIGGWLYYAQYSPESYVWVVEKEMDMA